MSAGEGDENAVEAFSPRPFVGSEAPVHTLQKLQLGDNVQGQRVDSPPANPTHPQNEFELIIKPTQDDSLREITNIVRPQPLQEISKEYSGICSLGQGKTEEGGSALISPSMKSAILTARKRNLTVVDKDTLNRKYEEFLEQRKRIEEMKQKAKLKDVFITELLSFNKLSLFFGGDCFPGEVTEESLEVFNKGGVELTYKIHLVCKDDALNELDEYVFSMRKTGSFDYNDKYLVVQSPGVKSTYKIALKVPNTREACPIDGFVVVFSDDCKGKVNIPIKSKVLPCLLLRF